MAFDPVQVSIPPRAPRLKQGLLSALCRWTLARAGWRIHGAFADVDKLLLIAAPHSSAWDGVWGLMIKIAIGIDIKILGKAELFKGLTGVLLGPLLRWLGVIPTDRHAANGLVGQIVDRFRDQGRFWLILAPEGTRRRVEKWRSGFWHIAQQAGVPIQCCYFHYPERTVGVGELFHTTGDLDADMAHLRSYYKAFQGLRRGA
ncbi:MAG: 1-acyl-sn-glycerol-3-phosphate acyltransferase [Xanthomonadales bacterium]|nr:1-acyl-sn-glycerol-3-phosphate acyltransferase [Xanthomonadales bacterium]